MSALTLNGAAGTFARISLPARGIWTAEVEANTATVLSGAVVVQLDDLTLRGTVITAGAVETRTRYRIAGGAGGWGRSIPEKPYTNDAGVKRSTVLGDAAAACGETLGSVPTGFVPGNHYARLAGPAARILDELCPEGWYVDEAGLTQLGRRPAVPYTGGATRMETDTPNGRIELAPASVATLLPGSVVDGIEAVQVDHVVDGKLRTTVWGRRATRTGDPLQSALDVAVGARVFDHRFFAPWEYRVVQRVGDRYDLQIVQKSTGMPDLRNVRIRPGVAGVRARPALGSLVIVAFVNGDQSRPMVVAFDEPEAEANFRATEIALQAGTTGAAPTEHAVSAEAMVHFVTKALDTLASALGAAGAGTTAVTAAIPASATSTMNPAHVTLLATALAAKTVDTSGDKPGLGWPNVRGG